MRDRIPQLQLTILAVGEIVLLAATRDRTGRIAICFLVGVTIGRLLTAIFRR